MIYWVLFCLWLKVATLKWVLHGVLIYRSSFGKQYLNKINLQKEKTWWQYFSNILLKPIELDTYKMHLMEAVVKFKLLITTLLGFLRNFSFGWTN